MKMKVEITLEREMLGTKPADKKVFETYVSSKAPDEAKRKKELQDHRHIEKAGTTIFLRDEQGHLYIQDYKMMGFLKAAGEALRQCNYSMAAEGDRRGKKWGDIRGKIDRFVLVGPERIVLGQKKADGICERPLRAQTMQGPRVTVVQSEIIKAGTSFDITIDVMDDAPISKSMIEEMLDYGSRVGLGQWRNSGKGRFTWKEITKPKKKTAKKKQ